MSFRLSFEFFPPRTEQGQASLQRVATQLDEFNPEFYSVTYGAGGSTRNGTRDTISDLQKSGRQAAPHLSIGDDDQSTINDLLTDYKNAGINRLVALRGDVPSGVGTTSRRHNAEELVRWIRSHSGDHFHIEVAAYPEIHPDANTPAQDMDYFCRKVSAGADSAITQFFYNPHSYIDFVNRCQQQGIDIPIYPGIMPLTNYEGIVRFAEKSGADIPRWLRKHLEAFKDDDEQLKAFGVNMVTQLCEDLIAAGAPGLHFYTLNRWGATKAICTELGLGAAGSRGTNASTDPKANA